MTNNRVFQIRCNDKELEAWRDMAKAAGLPLSVWMRARLSSAGSVVDMVPLKKQTVVTGGHPIRGPKMVGVEPEKTAGVSLRVRLAPNGISRVYSLGDSEKIFALKTHVENSGWFGTEGTRASAVAMWDGAK